MADAYEFWHRVSTVNGNPGRYEWLIWKVGPIDGANARWFENEDEARDYLTSVSGPDSDRPSNHAVRGTQDGA